jgi:hypothetical protein
MRSLGDGAGGDARIGIIANDSKPTVDDDAKAVILTAAKHGKCVFERHPLARTCVVGLPSSDVVRDLRLFGFIALAWWALDPERKPGTQCLQLVRNRIINAVLTVGQAAHKILAVKAKGVGAHFGALVPQIEMEKGAAANGAFVCCCDQAKKPGGTTRQANLTRAALVIRELVEGARGCSCSRLLQLLWATMLTSSDQCRATSVAFLALSATWSQQLTDSVGASRVRIPPSPPD